MFTIVGLGNPGTEYEKTRHNSGRIVLEIFRRKNGFPEWREEPKLHALVSEGKIGKEKVMLVLPETFMNRSGSAVAPLVKSRKAAERLLVVHDDLDLPFGRFKISFNKHSGGHRGVESVIKALKTEAFVRVRVGISPASAKASAGKPATLVIKKPRGEKAVEKQILGAFTPAQMKVLKRLSKKVSEALAVIITDGLEKAMNQYHS